MLKTKEKGPACGWGLSLLTVKCARVRRGLSATLVPSSRVSQTFRSFSPGARTHWVRWKQAVASVPGPKS